VVDLCILYNDRCWYSNWIFDTTNDIVKIVLKKYNTPKYTIHLIHINKLTIKTNKMKKAIFTFGLMLMATLAINIQAQGQPNLGGAELKFEKEVHDYGKIEQHGNGECEFVFTNTGNEPLIISKAKGSCGCTVPVWPKDPIAPGASSSIKVKYDTKRIGLINKTITITSNASNAPNAVIRIKGEILNPAAATTPASGN